MVGFSLGGAFASGAVWFALGIGGWQEGEFGLEPHPWAQPVRVVHGILSAVALVAFGMLLALHVPAGWRKRRRQISGAALVGAFAILAMTGWFLYYSGNEDLRAVARWMHNIAGLTFPLLVGRHIMENRKGPG